LLNPDLLAIPANRWVMFAEDDSDDFIWKPQSHSGACFDELRGRMMIFGSDGHGKNWDNSMHELNPRTEEWKTYHDPDPPQSYHIDANGVLRSRRGPPAQHVYGAMACDAKGKRVLVFSYPRHSVRNAADSAGFSSSDIRFWPTWEFYADTGRWSPLPVQAAAPTFFGSVVVNDPDRRIVVGLANSTHNMGIRGTWEFDLDNDRWRRIDARDFPVHGNAVYDTRHRQILALGFRQERQRLLVYRTGDGWTEIEEFNGKPPSFGQHVPMAYDREHGVLVAIFDTSEPSEPSEDGQRKSETWTYDYGGNTWNHIVGGDLPRSQGMNYLMVYDSWHDALLLVRRGRGGRATAWALRYEPASEDADSLQRSQGQQRR